MRNKIKVVFVINTITHYQLQFFNFLRRFLDIRVLFHSKNHKNYEFSYQRKNKVYNGLQMNLIQAVKGFMLTNKINNFNNCKTKFIGIIHIIKL